jgi:hypothetical protein
VIFFRVSGDSFQDINADEAELQPVSFIVSGAELFESL